MDPYSSPYIIPNNSLHNPCPHSLLSTRKGSLDLGNKTLRIPWLGGFAKSKIAV